MSTLPCGRVVDPLSSACVSRYVGGAIEHEPQGQPDEPDEPGHQKRRAPSQDDREPGDERHRDDRAETAASAPDAVGEAAFAGRKPFGDGAHAGRPAARLPDAEQEPEHGERGDAVGERVQARHRRPPRDDGGEPAPRPEPVHQPADRALRQRVAEKKRRRRCGRSRSWTGRARRAPAAPPPTVSGDQVADHGRGREQGDDGPAARHLEAPRVMPARTSDERPAPA